MSSQIKLVENAVSSSLRSLGYFKIQIATKEDSELSITADGTLRNIYLFVLIIKASRSKKNPISDELILTIKNRAQSTHREPWSACVTLDTKKKKVNEIKWADLSTL